MPTTGIFQHPDCARHDTGWNHPEHQGRLRAVMRALHDSLPDLHGDIDSRTAAPIDPARLDLVHTAAHVRHVRRACEHAIAEDAVVGVDALEADTVVSPGSWGAALGAAGSAIDAIDAVLDGQVANAFCPVRPPGHHATADRAMGFCLFNTAALAAQRAVEHETVDRVLIVDWDVHHGNGTQDIFYHRPDVYYLSMHQHPLYPGTGGADQRGAGPGQGTTLNRPMPAGLPPEAYVEALLEAVDQSLADFSPDLVVVSAGFDAAVDDPLGGFTLREEDFAHLTHELIDRTRPSAAGRLVSVLEGGYNPDELGRAVVAHVTALRDQARRPANTCPLEERPDE